MVVNILLYGAECWCLTEDLLSRLRSFHHRCIRAMCGVTRWHTWRHRIRTAELRKRLRVESIDFYVNLRMLRWAGHVARMGHERLPRRFRGHLVGSSPAPARASSFDVRAHAEHDAGARCYIPPHARAHKSSLFTCK